MLAPRARVRLEGDRLDLAWPELTECSGIAVRCLFGDGRMQESGRWSRVSASEESFRTSCGPLVIDLRLQPEDGWVRVQAAACAEADVDVTQLTVQARPALAGGPPGWVLYNGYQSWDPSGQVPATGSRDSWWTIGLASGTGAGLAAAAATAESCCTRFTLEDGVLSATWCEAETPGSSSTLFAARAGIRWQSEEVLLTVGADVRGSLRALAQRPCARTAQPPSGSVPVGWLSWYHYGPWVRRDDVMANAELLASEAFRQLGYRLVQVDDGWQEAYGEWVANTKFPGGLPALSGELAAHGQATGIWTAPFLVSVAADLASAAPEDWFVRDPETGERAIDPRHRAFGPMYVLDASGADVQAYLHEIFSGIYDAGVRYFKIDFLYAGAYAGVRALRAGVRAIREGVRDAYLLACGAPLLPVVGLVDGCRIGGDTATPQYDVETGVSRPAVFGEEVASVARNAAARHFLDPWFQLDPDVALVGGNLSLEQGRQLVTVAVLAGGPFFASDDLANLQPERLALLTNAEVLALAGGSVAVPDWEPDAGDRPPSHWRRDDVVAVFNWSAEDREIVVRAPGATRARDLWARRDVPQFRDGARLRVPANGVRLLRLR